MAEKKKRGRPTEFDPKFAEELLEYFSVDPYRERMRKVFTKKGDVIEIPEDVANDVPTLAGFAAKIGVHRDTIHQWTKDHPDFSDAYKKAKDLQENFMVINGNKGLLNPAFAIFTAKNVLGWRDKQPGEEDKVVVNNNVKVEAVDLEERIKQLKGDK